MTSNETEQVRNTIAGLKAQLKEQGKIRGRRVPVYRRDSHGNRLVDHYARDHVELLAGQIVQIAAATGVNDQSHQVVKDLHLGSSPHDQETRVVIYADDLFLLIEHAEAALAPAPAQEPAPVQPPAP